MDEIHLTLNPGELFAIVDPGMPGVMKVGSSRYPVRHLRVLQRAHANELTFALREGPFIDCKRAEAYVHRRLTDTGCLVRGELFRTDVAQLRLLIEDVRRREALYLSALRETAKYLDLGGFPGASFKGLVSDNPAISFIINAQCTYRRAPVTLAELMAAFAAGYSNALCARLEKLGLFPVGAGGRLFVFDKRPGCGLERLFSKSPGHHTWRAHLDGIAGLDGKMQPVNMATLKRQASSPFLLQMCDVH